MHAEYPLQDFLRDWDTVTALAESEEEPDFMRSVLHLRNYMRHTYENQDMQTRRGMALGFALNFLAENRDTLTARDFSPTQQEDRPLPKCLMNALHSVVVRWALNPKESPAPTAEAVREYARLHPSG